MKDVGPIAMEILFSSQGRQRGSGRKSPFEKKLRLMENPISRLSALLTITTKLLACSVVTVGLIYSPLPLITDQIIVISTKNLFLF